MDQIGDIKLASRIYQFGQKSFTFQEFLELTQYQESYGRNIIADLTKKPILEILPSKDDKRSKLYKLRWQAIKQLIIEGNNEKKAVLNELNLSGYEQKYIVLKNFKVFDDDFDLLPLIQRLFKEGVDPDVVVTNVGIPKQLIIYETE